MVNCSSLKKQPCVDEKACSWVKGSGCSKSGTLKTTQKYFLKIKEQHEKDLKKMSKALESVTRSLQAARAAYSFAQRKVDGSATDSEKKTLSTKMKSLKKTMIKLESEEAALK